ncbi:MAG: hypothetical protein M3383_04175 [Actinomycetota bacterium]|nr:hypothetical protein [Actinomycetota bacterium]
MRHTQAGQASLELLAGVPVLILAALVALQLAATAYTLHLADGAAEAGALAAAGGLAAEPAARAAMPGWAKDRVDVRVNRGRVEVRARPPGPVPAIAKVFEVRASAWAHVGDG